MPTRLFAFICSLWASFVTSGRLAAEAGVVTLAQAALNTQDDIDANIIDEFRKNSALLDALVFHDTVNPMGGGSTLTYGYRRTLALRSAAFRAINTEYSPQEATHQRFTVDLKPLGGSFQIDRVLAGIARGTEVSFQLQQLVTATTQKFQDEVINGDTNVDANGFDGLDKALRGSTTEINADTVTDWSDLDAYGFQKALDLLDTFLGVMDGAPTAILGNSKIIAKLWAIARRANSNVERPVDGLLGANHRPITRKFYGENVALIDLGDKPGSTNPIIPVESRDPDSTVYTVTVTGSPTGGTYTLTVTTPDGAQTTAAIAYNATAATVQAAIEALSNVPTGAVSVSGSGPYTVTFVGDLTDQVVTVALANNSLTGGSSPSVTTVEAATTTNYSGLTDLYAVRIGMDGFHGVSVLGDLLKTWLPDFERAGAVKTGEVEMGPAAVVLKATKAAAVLRNIKVL
jgi:hypothetical protein